MFEKPGFLRAFCCLAFVGDRPKVPPPRLLGGLFRGSLGASILPLHRCPSQPQIVEPVAPPLHHLDSFVPVGATVVDRTACCPSIAAVGTLAEWQRVASRSGSGRQILEILIALSTIDLFPGMQ